MTRSGNPLPRGVGGPARPECYRQFALRIERVEACAARAADRAAPRRQAGRRLRGARKGEHAAQLLRDPDGFPRLHGRSQPVQARAVHSGHTHPDPPPERLAQTRPDAIVILPGTSRPRSRPARLHRRVGAKLIVPVPTATFVEPGSTTRLSSPRALSSSCSTDATR